MTETTGISMTGKISTIMLLMERMPIKRIKKHMTAIV
jgi:hypothetical protein